jgi:hypothetical protein
MTANMGSRTRFWIVWAAVVAVSLLVALVSAGGTRPEDKAWLAAKAKEDGVVATGTGLLYKGACVSRWSGRRWLHGIFHATVYVCVCMQLHSH